MLVDHIAFFCDRGLAWDGQGFGVSAGRAHSDPPSFHLLHHPATHYFVYIL